MVQHDELTPLAMRSRRWDCGNPDSSTLRQNSVGAVLAQVVGRSPAGRKDLASLVMPHQTAMGVDERCADGQRCVARPPLNCLWQWYNIFRRCIEKAGDFSEKPFLDERCPTPYNENAA